MNEWLLPAGTAVAALVLTYLFCLRPMRRGQCGSVPAGRPADPELSRALVHARAELARLEGESTAQRTTSGATPSQRRSTG